MTTDTGDGPTDDQTLLIRLWGPDQPGITTDLMSILASLDCEVQDLEQVLVRGHLTLAVAVRLHPACDAAGGPGAVNRVAHRNLEDLESALRRLAAVHGLESEVGELPARSSDKGRLDAVTVLGHGLETCISPTELGAVSGAVNSAGGNIDRIVRLAQYPVYAYELTVAGADPIKMRKRLGEVAAQNQLDIAIQQEGLGRRAKRLVVLDVDSTLIQDEVIELLGAEAGCESRIKEITDRAMLGEIDFEQALRERVRLLKGLDADAIGRARATMRLTPGARTFVRTLKLLGYSVGIVSGGFTDFTDWLAAELDLDHAVANQLEISDGVLTGEVIGEVVDRKRKAALLKQFAAQEMVPLSQTVAVGDGANDLDMLAVAGLGIAFNAKPVVQRAADTTVNVPYLDAILFVLGVTREEVERADILVPD